MYAQDQHTNQFGEVINQSLGGFEVKQTCLMSQLYNLGKSLCHIMLNFFICGMDIIIYLIDFVKMKLDQLCKAFSMMPES